MTVLFYICAALAVLAALNVVLQRTPVYSALSLIVVLCSLAVVYLWLGVPLVTAFLAEILIAVWRQFPPGTTLPPPPPDGSPAAIGHLLFQSHVLPFEVTSILILVAVLGAVVLAKKEF